MPVRGRSALWLILAGAWAVTSAYAAFAAKLISYGWGTPETAYLKDHWRESGDTPFDGVGVTIAIDRDAWSEGAIDTNNQLNWHVFGPKAFHLSDFREAIADLRSVASPRLTHNFLPACIASSGQDQGFDWFDDERWQTVLNNWRTLVTIAARGRCKGIILDPEHYGANFFNYPSMNERTPRPFPAYQALLRQRGRELMAVTRQVFPDITLLMFWGHSYLAIHPTQKLVPPESNAYGLLPAFIDGLLEAADPRTQFVDACEFAYGFRERRQFLEAYHSIRNKAASFSALPELYRARMNVGFGLWIDNGGAKRWNTEDLSANYFTPDQFRQSLQTALELTDEYVWIYSQTPRFFPPSNLPEPYLQAMRDAKAATIDTNTTGVDAPQPLSEATMSSSDKKRRRVIKIDPRYYRWHVDPGVEWTEANTGYATLNWEIPIERAAVVLVDVWDRHYLIDTHARAVPIIENTIAPLLDACRKAGLQLIHAPSPPQAEGEPLRSHLPEGVTPPASIVDDEWPPPEFRASTGEFASFKRPVEPREEERREWVDPKIIHPLAAPKGDDVVVATGEELHQYCKQNGIVFLFFLGFNTNACILLRDYGTIHMGERGYTIIILRDCGTAMESFESRHGLGQTKGTILFLEMFGKYSLTSDELIQGLPAPPK